MNYEGHDEQGHGMVAPSCRIRRPADTDKQSAERLGGAVMLNHAAKKSQFERLTGKLGRRTRRSLIEKPMVQPRAPGTIVHGTLYKHSDKKKAPRLRNDE